METKDKFLHQYRKDIKLMLPMYGKKEKRYLDKLFDGIKDYMEDNPNAAPEQIRDKFGSPADIAGTYISCADQDYLLKHLRKNSIIKKGVCLVITILIIFCVSVSSIMYLTYLDGKKHNIDSVETSIEYITPEEYWEGYQDVETSQ